MHHTNFIPIDAILKDIYFLVGENNIQEDFVMEMAIYAMEQLTTHKLYEMAVCVLPVNNSTASYPSGMIGIQSVMYNKDNSYIPETFITTTTTTALADEDSQPISTNTECKITDFRMKRFESCGWRHLSLSQNTYDRTVMCNDSPNLHSMCDHWFIPDNGSNRFIVSFDTGLLAVAYYRYLSDDKGRFLIPDHALYKEAVQSYIFYKMYQRLWHASKQGAQSKYEHYLRKWQELCAAVVGEFMMMSLPEYANLDKQNRFFKDTGNSIYRGNNREYFTHG